MMVVLIGISIYVETLEVEQAGSTNTVGHLLPIGCQYEGMEDEQELCDLWCQIQVFFVRDTFSIFMPSFLPKQK